MKTGFRGATVVAGVAAFLLMVSGIAHAAPGDNGPLSAPNLHKPNLAESTARSVTLHWTDRSDNEQGFRVYRLKVSGSWVLVADVATRNMPGMNDFYTATDTDTSMSAQCYQVVAYNAANTATSATQCTVRPDPNRFPQVVSASAVQWFGLTSVSGAAGPLRNRPLFSSHLVYSDRVFGVNLDWDEDGPSLWRVEGQAGTQIMWGESVALKVWGGGWLTYGDDNVGVELELSDTPIFEWYIVNGQPGEPMTGADFALWNRRSGSYLKWGQQQYGVNLVI